MQCCKKIFSGDRWDQGGHQCSRRAKVEVDGKHYCAIHDPEAIRKKRERRDAELAAYYERERAASRLKAAAPELLAALKEVVAIADRKTDAFDRAKAAIAKAEGKTA